MDAEANVTRAGAGSADEGSGTGGPAAGPGVPLRAVGIMGLYAGLLVAGGVIAYLIAPPDAKAATALIVPSACAVLVAVCAGLSALLPKSKLAGMIGIHAGLVLPVLFALAFVSRAIGNDKAYLATTLWVLAGVSAAAFVALLMNRPKPAARG